MTVIYLDLLILVNMVLNFVMLTIAGWLGLHSFSFGRYLLASGVGTGCFLIYFLWPEYIFLEWACRLIGPVAMTWTAWRLPVAKLISRAFLIVVAGQLVGGGIFSLLFLTGGAVLGSPGPVPLGLVLGGAVLMLVAGVAVVTSFNKGRRQGSYIGRVEICCWGQRVTVQALLDSGNTLRHPVTGWPVIIVEPSVAEHLLGWRGICWVNAIAETPPEFLATRSALIPCATIQGAALLAAFRPDEVVIHWQGQRRRLHQVFVAVRPRSAPPLAYPAVAFVIENWEEGDSVGANLG